LFSGKYFQNKEFVAVPKLHLLGFIWLTVPFACSYVGEKGHMVAQLVEALHYKPEVCGFNSQQHCWNFSLT
jgi:hypothetical protein